MSIAWYIVPRVKETRPDQPQPARLCEIALYTRQILDAGGKVSCIEVLGNRDIVKVIAPDAILAILDGKYKRLPKDRLDDSLSDLPVTTKAALKDEILDMGYSIEELREKFSSDLQCTLRDILSFMATRKRQFRRIPETGDYVCDGAILKCHSIEYLDSKVQ